MVGTFMGVNVHVVPDAPRYQLPERLSLPCGVDLEWPPGFRDEFNEWARSFLGSTCLLRDGEVLMIGRTSALMNLRTYEKFKAECQYHL